ncbi:MAG: hypothetical protein KA807_03195 [Prolixibacteraceae bacterium]|nr:hypothetical protein [Prolixibacteraceae bacterium]
MRNLNHTIQISLIICLLMLQGCFYSNYKYLKSYNSGEEPYKLNLKPGTELLLMREDIYRNTYTEEKSTSDSTKETVTTDANYHPLGFRICKGVFLDINENLFLNIPELFNTEETKNYQIVCETPTLFGKNIYKVIKEGNEISRISESLLGNSVDKITLFDDKITIKESGLFSSTNTIDISNEKISYKYGLINILPPSITKESENEYVIKSGFDKKRISQIDENKISIKKYFDIARLNDKIEFKFKYGYNNPFILIKTDTGYLFENSKGYLVKIIIDSDTIEVWYDKRLERTYYLKKL